MLMIINYTTYFIYNVKIIHTKLKKWNEKEIGYLENNYILQKLFLTFGSMLRPVH